VFGYITVDKPELKVKEHEAFRSYYCGLCRTLRTYGAEARLTLSHDCSFLYLLAASLTEVPPRVEIRRCFLHPTLRRAMTLDAGADYAAAVNILLAAGKLRDDVADDKNPLAWAGAKGLLAAERKARGRYPKTALVIEEQMLELSALEREGCKDIDRTANAFAQMLARVMVLSGYGEPRAMKSLGYHIGRWLYLIDAYDDVQKDMKKGRFNPYISRFGAGAEKEAAIKESARFNLYASLAGACAAFDLLEIKKNKPILENILYSGLYKRTEWVINGGMNGSL